MNMIVAYWSFKPMEGGVDITYVVTADIAGMIPGFVKTQIAKRGANIPLLVLDYL